MRPQHENNPTPSVNASSLNASTRVGLLLAALLTVVLAVTALFGAGPMAAASATSGVTPSIAPSGSVPAQAPALQAASAEVKKAPAKKAAQKKVRAQAAAKKARAKQARAVAMKRLAKKYPRTAAKKMMKNRSYSRAQRVCVVNLWNKESNWRWWAANPSSSAYGIPQALPGSKMRSAGVDWRTNPVTQIKWGLKYIKDRYGKPCNAWRHSQSRNWY